MYLKHLLLPILALIIALIGIFAEHKQNRRFIIFLLAIVLVISTAIEIPIRINNQKIADAEIAWQKQHISNVKAVDLIESIHANQERTIMASEREVEARSNILIEYYQRMWTV